MPNRAQRRQSERLAKQPAKPGFRPQVVKGGPDMPMPLKPRNDVLLGYLAPNMVTTSFMISVIDLLGHDSAHAGRLKTYGAGRTGPLDLVKSRNMLAEAVMADPELQWLFMVDSDMGFKPDTLDRLLEAADPTERPVVGALCFAMREAGPDGYNGFTTFPQPTILVWEQNKATGVYQHIGREHYPVNQVIRVTATGAACILIHRSVFERIREAEAPAAEQPESAEPWAQWFNLKPAGDGGMQGEDISFCDRCCEQGIPIWIHTGVRTTHMKTVWLGEGDFWASREVARPATERVRVLLLTEGKKDLTPLLDHLQASTGLARVTVCGPETDHTTSAADHPVVDEIFVSSAAIPARLNAANVGDEPWVFVCRDDVEFRPRWLDEAENVARIYDAKVVGTNDLLDPAAMTGEMSLNLLIRRDYIDEVGGGWDGPGVLAHEGYSDHFWEHEIVFAARERRAYQHAMGSFVARYKFGKVNPETFDDDRNLFAARREKATAEFVRSLVSSEA